MIADGRPNNWQQIDKIDHQTDRLALKRLKAAVRSFDLYQEMILLVTAIIAHETLDTDVFLNEKSYNFWNRCYNPTINDY